MRVARLHEHAARDVLEVQTFGPSSLARAEYAQVLLRLQNFDRRLVEFLQGTHYRRVVVAGLPATSISKELARTMYVDETPKQEVIEKAATLFRERGSGRPTKKERRDIEKLRR